MRPHYTLSCVVIPTMTYELAMAASRDAGDRHMRQHGPTKWNRDDWNAAVEEFNRLFPKESQIAWVKAGRPRDLPIYDGPRIMKAAC